MPPARPCTDVTMIPAPDPAKPAPRRAEDRAADAA